jgi:hypothetical protein
MGRTIFYDICLTALAIIFSIVVRVLSDGKHYSKQRPPIKIRSVCIQKYLVFKYILIFSLYLVIYQD